MIFAQGWRHKKKIQQIKNMNHEFE